MTVALFLSPHLDDAILSCAGRIQRHVAHAERVVLLTAFSHADPEDAAGWAARRREDETAAARLGAEPRWLGLPDAPFRDPAYAGFTPDVLTSPHAPGDTRWRERLMALLRAEVEALRPFVVYAPLGVGDHVDHRLVLEAAAGLEPRPCCYEDHPYALVLHAVRRRLDALGLEPEAPEPAPSSDDYLDDLVDAPYVQRHLDPSPARDRWLERLRPWPTSTRRHSVHAELEQLDPAAAALAEQAIWDYASQAPELFGTRERYRSLVRTYAERLGTAAPRAERYWLGVTPA
jgi:LmbE family N-acetylglucosaminyl deacetylase